MARNISTQPGSDEAIAAGCSCPVVDNHHGKGMPGGMFWVDAGCPLHGRPRRDNALGYAEDDARGWIVDDQERG